MIVGILSEDKRELAFSHYRVSGMHVFSIVCIVFASINLYVGLSHLAIFLRRRRTRENVPFFFLCLTMAVYDAACAGLYGSGSIEEGVFWMQLQLSAIFFISIFIAWFIWYFAGKRGYPVLLAFQITYAALFLVSLFIDPVYTLPPGKTAIKHVHLADLISVTYYENEIGPLYTAAICIAIAVFVVFLILLIRQYFANRRKSQLFLIISVLAYFVGSVNDFMVVSNVYSFIYLSEYAFMVITIAMSYLFVGRYINFQKSLESLNEELENRVIERTEKITALNLELKQLSEIDGLTGIYNRRFFNEYIEIEVQRARNEKDFREKITMSGGDTMNFGLAILDVDDFKMINDTYGHLAGDAVLKEMVSIIKDNIFTRDVLCRYGGEEFALLLTKTSRDGIRKALEKIQNEIDAHRFTLPESADAKHVTISAGIATFDEIKSFKAEEIIRLADERLLCAKRSGKNRVVAGP